jgi:hypothetical protein
MKSEYLVLGLLFILLVLPHKALAEACIPGAISSSPCPDSPSIQEIADGPTVTKCPDTYVFEGCTSKPKAGGSANTLCCRNPVTGGTAQDCSPKTPETGFTYLCMFKEGCASAGGTQYVTKPEDAKCGDNSQWCCKAKSRTGETVTPNKKPPAVYNLANPLGTESIPVILGRIIKAFLGIVGALALAVFVYGGVMWMTARGDSAQVKKGQDALKNATIGLFLIMFSYGLTGAFLQFWTSEQKNIAAQEGRTVEDVTAADAAKGATIQSAADAAAKDKAAQGGAAQAGTEAGVTPTPDYCLSPPKLPSDPDQAKQAQDTWDAACANIPAQSSYNTPAPSQGFGGQPTCPQPNPNLTPDAYQDAVTKYNECLKKTSAIGWKTVCGETVFDSGYGSFNGAACTPLASCTGSILSGDCVQLGQMAGTLFSGIPNAAGIIGSKCVKLPSPLGFGSKCTGGTVCCKP